MITRSLLELPAGEFSYLEVGEGEPVVFLHALGRSASDWTTVMESMSDAWRCLALDQRGHGDSVRPDSYSFEAMEGDLRSFVDTLGLDRLFLVGHSMGGSVGWLFAEKTPGRLRGLVVEDTPPPHARHIYPSVPETPPQPVSYDWAVRRQLFRQLNSPDPSWWDDVSKVTTRTLVIAGSANEEELQDMVRRLPDGHLTKIEAGHWIHENEPESFVSALRAFLKE